MTTKTESIKGFLTQFTHKDLASLYNFSMEVQVNVAQDNGEIVQEKSGYTGRMWRGYTDGVQTWKSFRIPWNASTDPEYTDRLLNWDLSVHAEGIGMTGWDWEHKVSKWVAFDFDSIVGHSETSKNLTAIELKEVQEVACSLPWVTVRKSTSGQGLHLYVFLNNIKTKNHTEHAALARSILGQMTSSTGFEFSSKVDTCGGNIWVWHRKMKGTDGLTLIKKGEVFFNVPVNWQDHIPVITGRRKKNLPHYIKDSEENLFEQLTSQRAKAKLDSEHMKLIKFLEEKNCAAWWDSDRNLLVCHTFDLKLAHTELGLRGIFETVATGKEQGGDWNCFCTPLQQPSGAWVVRRFTPGVQESPTWSQDTSGWTKCFYNQTPSLATVARARSGIEGEKGDYFFNEAETAALALQELGTFVNLPTWACNRDTTVKEHKDGKRLIVKVKREVTDKYEDMVGWKEEKGWWTKIFNSNLAPSDIVEPQNYDDFIRHLVTADGEDCGWVIKSANQWHGEPISHIKIALKSIGLGATEIDKVLGRCVIEGWALVNKPFQPEYTGNREWNRKAVQFRYPPQLKEPFIHRTWDKIIDHCGKGLTNAVKQNKWCRENAIDTGSDYLRLWVASLFQFPLKQLPYLFLYSREQQTGKTSFHEAISLLMTPSGYQKGSAALINSGGFNAELEHTILCALDECDLRKGSFAKNRIKEWIASKQILVHPKGLTPYLADNTIHFIQTGNDPGECPIDVGDDRIIMIQIEPLPRESLIDKEKLTSLLIKEAPAFLATLLATEIPLCNDRLNLPVINTDIKMQSSQLSRNQLEVFIDECTFYVSGSSIRYSEFYNKFQEWLDPSDVYEWTKIKMGRSLPSMYPKGRLVSDGGQFHLGNISFEKKESTMKKLVLKGDTLIEEEN